MYVYYIYMCIYIYIYTCVCVCGVYIHVCVWCIYMCVVHIYIFIYYLVISYFSCWHVWVEQLTTWGHHFAVCFTEYFAKKSGVFDGEKLKS